MQTNPSACAHCIGGYLQRPPHFRAYNLSTCLRALSRMPRILASRSCPTFEHWTPHAELTQQQYILACHKFAGNCTDAAAPASRACALRWRRHVRYARDNFISTSNLLVRWECACFCPGPLGGLGKHAISTTTMRRTVGRVFGEYLWWVAKCVCCMTVCRFVDVHEWMGMTNKRKKYTCTKNPTPNQTYAFVWTSVVRRIRRRAITEQQTFQTTWRKRS